MQCEPYAKCFSYHLTESSQQPQSQGCEDAGPEKFRRFPTVYTY